MATSYPYAVPRTVAPAVTASGVLAKGVHTPVLATTAAVTMTLPGGASVGAVISVEKTDPTAHAVTVAGSIRGSASTVVLSGQYQTVEFIADATGSWWPTSGAGATDTADPQSMAQRSTMFMETMMGATTVVTSESSIEPDVGWPPDYIGPVNGRFDLAQALTGEATTQRCHINVNVPVGALADSFRGVVYGSVTPAPGVTGYTLQAYKEVDTEYVMPSTCPVDATTGNFALDLSTTPDWQKGAWRIGLLDPSSKQVGTLWPSPVTYTDLQVESRVITDTTYLSGTQFAATTGRWNFLTTLNGRKQFRLVRISTGAVLAEYVPLLGNVRSYLPRPGEPGYGTNFDQQCYSYDQAITLLAAMAAGKRAAAAKLVNGLLLLQTQGGAHDGGWIFSGPQLAPQVGDPSYRTGAHSICLYALLRFMQVYPDDHRHDYAGAARRGFAFLTTMMSGSGNTAGLYLGGVGTYDAVGGGGQRFNQDYDITWASSEHNFDSWHALNLGASVLGDATLATKRDTLKAAIMAKLWSGTRFYQGIHDAGPDTADPLDMHSWGAIFLMAIGELDKATSIMSDAMLAPLHFIMDGCQGYAPCYAADPGYPQATPTIWAEGTFGVALAYLAIGQTQRWYDTILGVMPAQAPDGAYPYVTTANAAYEWTPSHAVIGPAWSVLASAGFGVWGVTQSPPIT